MSEHYDKESNQPLPITSPNSVDVAVEAAIHLRSLGLTEIAEDIEDRIKIGERKYGSRLKSFNGRDALQDALDECLDLINYSKQCQIEGLDKDGTLFLLSMGVAALLKEKILFNAPPQESV